MREAIEIEIYCDCAVRLGKIRHQEVEYDGGVPDVHRVQVVCRDRDEE